MGVIVNKKNEQDELSQRINADLRAKAMETSDIIQGEDPDFTEGSEYMQDFKKSGKLSWVWFLLIGLALLALIPIFIL